MIQFLKAPNINILWAKMMVEELLRQGVRYFCLAPGSRSSPLAVAVADNPDTRNVVHIDERGLGFHALGYTAAAKEPSAVICTSGTAVANLLPAIIEASKKKLPLIIITADRPPELRKTGAMQTIDQAGIFGSCVRWQTDMPCPTKEITPAFVLTTIDQAVHRAKGSPGGPVHLNCMYREPLAPINMEFSPSAYLRPLEHWMKSKRPYTEYQVLPPQLLLEDTLADRIISEVKKIKKGVIVAGKLSTDEERKGVLSLSRRLSWPVFPDITSGLRLGSRHKNCIPYFDLILLMPKILERCPFDGVLHLGGRITSKRWNKFLDDLKPKHYIMVLDHPLRNDPLHNVTLRVEAPVTEFCKMIQNKVLLRRRKELNFLREASEVVEEALSLTHTRARKSGLNEPAVARLLSQNIPKQTGLFLANSMPIRDMDTFGSAQHHPVVIGGNRGASGIDGTVATAAGMAAGLDKPVTLLTGDLALLHDLNSLAMIKNLNVQLIIIVINNNGGGIFSFLPIARFENVFETYFGTPHNLQFELASQLFGLHYASPKTQGQFVAEYNMAIIRKKSTIIEIATDRTENYAYHQNLESRIVTVLKKYFT